MQMQELSRQQMNQQLSEGKQPFAVYLYTPLCGTCKIARQMLDIVTVMEPSLPIYQMNINYIPDLSMEWKIRSVPCLIIVQNGQVKAPLYRMESVDHLLVYLRAHLRQ